MLVVKLRINVSADTDTNNRQASRMMTALVLIEEMSCEYEA